MAPDLIINPTAHQVAVGWRPKISHWRNNLTALSQCRNLYFVASVDRIFIYRPTYPNQNISRHPIAILLQPPPRTNLCGYIHPTRPQGINHLIIRDLGDEEILLFSCDNGDVLSFFTSNIEQAIPGDVREVDDLNDVPTLSLIPFFRENVGASAWGLDVHKSARLIAVSSNTTMITVFAFALSPTDPDDYPFSNVPPANAEDRQEFVGSCGCPIPAVISPHWKAREDASDCYRRDKCDFAWSLDGHDANIPAIAFWNGARRVSDPIYLTSVDIDGQAKIWDVWAHGRQALPHYQARGWAIACLDPSTARIVSSEEAAFGCEPDKQHCREMDFFLIDDSIRNVQDNSLSHPNYPGVPPASPSAETQSSGGEHSDEMDTEDDVSESSPSETELTPIVHGTEGETEAVVGEDEVSDEGTSTIPIEITDHKIQPTPNIPSREARPTPLFELPFNIFLTSGSCFSLMGPHQGGNPFYLSCGEPVHQVLTPNMGYLSRIQRLNMIHYVPEIGILIVGDQIGRVAFLSLTYWPEKRQHGLKIEAIVPFKSQEDQGMRPEQPLLGLAVSPVQGCQRQAYSPSDGDVTTEPQHKNSQNPRYRLLLLYYNHTFMAYQLHRPVKGDGIIIV